MNINASQAYRRMIKTAYGLALHPQFPLKSFKLLVKSQRMHGVTLISGKDDNHVVSEYLESITTAIEEKVAVIMARSHFFSLLSDRSQARKTGSGYKARTYQNRERCYTGLYITLSSLEMPDFDVTDAASLKKRNYLTNI